MTQEELKLVLEALKWCHGGEPCGTAEAIAVVEKALAQPEQCKYPDCKCPTENPCLKGLAQRTWVGLTNDELTDLFYNTNLGQQSAVAQAIALLKEHNT